MDATAACTTASATTQRAPEIPVNQLSTAWDQDDPHSMKLPARISLRTELLIALAMFVIVNVLSAVFQPQIAVNDGKGWDGASYYTVAQEFSDGQTLAADFPFVSRIGTPFLASRLFKDDLILSFKIVNLAANVAMTLLLGAWLRLYVRDWRVRLSLIAAFLLEWHGPVRFIHFYPVAADNWFVTLLLAGLLGIHILRRQASWLVIGAVSVLALCGVLVRESGLLIALVVPLARNPLRLQWRLPRIPVAWFIPLGVALAGYAGLYLVTHMNNTPSPGGGGPLIVPKSVPAYLLGWWTAFGPLLILPLFCWRKSLAFLWEHQYMAGLLVAVTLLASFQSPALQLPLQDTERYLFWAMPIVYVLIGRALDELLPIVSAPLLGVLVAAQALAERAFWTIPQPGAGDSADVFSHGASAFLLFTPLGGNVKYFDIFPAWMTQGYRLILLGEYLALGFVVLAWLYWQSSRARSPRPAQPFLTQR
jgi:hypothetical protein